MNLNLLKKCFLLIKRKLAALPFNRRHCCVCRKNILAFLPYRGFNVSQQIIEVLDIVGSDVKQFSCPNCGCHDRERHLVLYLAKLGLLDKFRGAKILHFAPEHRLSEIILEQNPLKYIPCDLFPSNSKIHKIDMLDISYESESFDFIIANHVLEHVYDDSKALSEIHRVLKNGGYAILQTPFSAKLKSTFSDSGIDDDLARLYMFGQEDHQRLYGKDIFSRIESAGFSSQLYNHNDVLESIDTIRYGVNIREPFFLFKKNN